MSFDYRQPHIAPAVQFELPPEFAGFLERTGRYALSLGDRPPRKFEIISGGRRMLVAKTARPAVELKIVSRKENP